MKLGCKYCGKISEYLSVVLVIMLTFIAGLGLTQTNIMVQSGLSSLNKASAERQEQHSAALAIRVERYRTAFIERDYETMYHLSHFKNVPKPTLTEFRQMRNPHYQYDVAVRLVDITMEDDKGAARLELTIQHPNLGVNRTVHLQEWELVEGLWYRIDYAY